MRIDTNTDLRELLKENIKLSKAILRNTDKTAKAMKWMQVMSFLRILLIIIPIILAVLYIPPFLQSLVGNFGQFYGGDQLNILDQFKNLNPTNVNLDEVKNILK